jgi:hypothetical protein
MGMQEEGKKKEEQWFHERERKIIDEMKTKREERIRSQKHEELKQRHWMCCPKCGHSMKEQELGGIKVDVCTICEGIYFDRGELEDLLLVHGSESRSGFFRRLFGLNT